MIWTAHRPPRPVPIELSDDPGFRRRVGRLSVVSMVALGLIWALAMTTTDAPIPLDVALFLGWILMPTTLVASLGEPRIRYALIIPATLVTLGLLGICLGWLPSSPLAVAGWWLLAGGVGYGGLLGLWFWYRLVPVPAMFDDPFSPGRWALISAHVGAVVIGFVLALLGAI